MKTIDAETTEKLRAFLARRLAKVTDDVIVYRRPLVTLSDSLRRAARDAQSAADGEYYEPGGLARGLGEADFAAGRLFQLRVTIAMLRDIAAIAGLDIEEDEP